ncbi:MAG TPA: hypothetical protein VIX63_07120 [Vicinamibacterales bacterium]
MDYESTKRVLTALEREDLMPVRKFRRVEEMEQPTWREPGDPNLYRTIAHLWEFGRRTGGRRFPPGVYRHRSVQDLNAQTEQWSVDDFKMRPGARSRS